MVAIRFTPPKIIAAVNTTKTRPTYSPCQFQAFLVASTIEFACTELNAKPKVKINDRANATANQRDFKPCVI